MMLLKSKRTIFEASLMVMVALAGGIAYAQGDLRQDPAFQRELLYIEALTNARMIDYASRVTQDLERKYPEAGVLLKTTKLNQTLQLGKFDEAMAMIAQEPDQESPTAWAMKLTVADYHYARGNYQEALKTYHGFFTKYKNNPPAAIASFYKESYYKFAQMLIFLDQPVKAIEAYEGLLAIEDLDSNTRRQASFEMTELMVKQADKMKPGKEREEFLKKTKKRAEDLMWIPDLWFGRSLALLAHIYVLQDDVQRANKLLKDYMPQLRNIDKQLQEQSEEMGEDLSNLSPIAECRFLMGVMMQDAADQLLDSDTPDVAKASELLIEALGHFVNVYARYPSTSWAPDAMVRSEEVQTTLKERAGVRDIQMNITAEQRKTIAEKQFANARKLFNQQQLEAAASAYEVVLSQYPDAIPESIQAASEFARTYIQLGDNESASAEEKLYYALCAEALIGHIAERFSQSNPAGITLGGDVLRRIADDYTERNMIGKRDAVMELFFKHYTKHPLAAQLLMTTADKFQKDGNLEAAIPYFQRLAEDYQSSSISYSAMMRLADCYSKLGNVEAEIAARKLYLERVEARSKKNGKPHLDEVVGRYMLVRVERNEAIRKLREANEQFEAARRGEKPAVEAAPEKAEADAAGAEKAEAESVAEDPIVAATKAVRRANNDVVRAAAKYIELRKILEGPNAKQYQENEKQEKTFNSIHQSCLFDLAYTLSAITQPPEKVANYKMNSIKIYESILEKFPEIEGAPTILMQIGTLWSTIRTENAEERDANIKKADAAFRRLADEYPESEQAKNALFLQGRTLIELGFRAEGIVKFKRMFEDAKKFSAAQHMLAAQELLKSKELTLARQGFEIAFAAGKEDPAICVPTQIGIAELLLLEGKYAEAVEALESFMKDYPTSYKILDANTLMAKAAALATENESDEGKRSALFVRALNSVKQLAQYQKTPKDLAEQTIKVGEILETRIRVEKKFKNPQVNRYVGEAQGHYQQFIFSADAQDATIQPSLEMAYNRSLALLLEMKTYRDGSPVYADVKQDCEHYLELFPKGRFVAEIKQYLTQAEIMSSAN